MLSNIVLDKDGAYIPFRKTKNIFLLKVLCSKSWFSKSLAKYSPKKKQKLTKMHNESIPKEL